MDSYSEEGLLYRLEYNFLERLWAYLTLQNLFVKLARGELVSCQQPAHHHPQVPLISYSCVLQLDGVAYRRVCSLIKKGVA